MDTQKWKLKVKVEREKWKLKIKIESVERSPQRDHAPAGPSFLPQNRPQSKWQNPHSVLSWNPEKISKEYKFVEYHSFFVYWMNEWML